MFYFLETTDIVQDTAQNDVVDFVSEVLATVNEDQGQ